MGPINPPGKRTDAYYIITVMDYLTRWVDTVPVMDCTTSLAAKFIFENIVTLFGFPRILMSDYRSHFINCTVKALTK